MSRISSIAALTRRRALPAFLLCLLTLGACSNEQAPADAATMLHRGMGDEPESLDMHKTRSTEAGDVQRDLGEGLIAYTPDGELYPAAAQSWQLSADGLTYDFTLREDARWSNGDAVTAADFVYSFRRLVDPATAAVYVQSVEQIANASDIVAGSLPASSLGVAAPDSRTLRVTLKQAVPYFLDLLTHPSMFPVHPASVEAHGDAYARPGNLVSNGAYRLTGWEVGSYIELERNEFFRDAGNVAIDRVRHYVTSEPMAELNRFRAGELDTTRTIPPAAFQQMRETRPEEVRVSPALGVYFFGYNMQKTPFAEQPKLRAALSMALDRETIVEKIIGRGEAPAYGWVPEGTANYDPRRYAWADLGTEERHKRARELYREAGYGPDNPLRTELRYNTSDTHQKVALAVQSMWREVLGAEITLVNEEFQVLLANVMQRDITRIVRLNWNGDYNDAHTFLSIMESDNPSNFTGYSSEEFDALMQKAVSQTDPAMRKVFLEEAERVMLEDHPLIPVYFYVNKSMVSKRVRGWGDNVLNYHYSQHLSLDGKQGTTD